jgi:TonB family protein
MSMKKSGAARKTLAVLVAGSLLLFSAVSLADCARPRPSFQVPEGGSVSEQQMTSAGQQLVKFSDEVRDYLRCLNGEVSQKTVGKDEAARQQLAQEYLKAHQEAANELNGLADCYGEQLKTFKSSGGGTQQRPADCSSFIAAAATRQRTGAQTTEVVVEASGSTVEVPGGSWLYYLVRSDDPRSCSGQPCLYRALHVRNDSDSVLECNGEITYEGVDVAGNATTRSRALVPERSTYVVTESHARQGVDAKVFDMNCTARAKLPPLPTAANCKYEVVQPVAIGDYYPDAAREAGEEGPVTVEFTLPGKAANPKDVRVVASSLFQSLDQAAVKAVSDMVMSSNCPKARYRLKLSFQLEQ